jgi:hypothetical protein
LHPERARGRFQRAERRRRRPGVGRIDQHGNPDGCGHQLTQKPEPLRDHVNREERDAGGIAARVGKARHQTHLDRVVADAESDRNRRGCRFRRERGEV